MPQLLRLALNGWFLQAPLTGTGQYLRQLIAALAPPLREANGELALIADRPDSTVSAPVCIVRPRLGGNPGKVEFEQVSFPRACTRGRFNVAHVPHFGPPLYPSVPTVVTVHDLIPLLLPAYRASLAVRAYTALAARAARRALVIAADSQATRRDILRRLGVPEERVRVVYLAADARFRPASEEEIARVRNRYALPERFVLYLGGYDVRKNIRLLVQAFEALREEREAGWRLVLAGRRPQKQSSLFPDPRSGASPDVRWVDDFATEDQPALYSAAGVFAFPSHYEGFGLPPLEAMACGAPVVCSNSSSLPEVVGEAGVLVSPTEPQHWAAALRWLLNDPTARAERRARGLAQARQFSWERTAREMLELYQSVLPRQAGAI